jgi:hypothetical protein
MKSKLMVYEGGGYSGCFWEYNMCAWDQNGDWHDVFSSGRDGLTTEEMANEAIRQKSHKHVLFDMNVKKEMNVFRDDYAVNLVFEAVKYFSDHKIESKLMLKCCECGTESDDVDNFCLEGLRGDGGIHYSNTDIICFDCRSNSSCDYCGEYFPDANVSKALVETHNGEKYCEFCLKSNIESGQTRLKHLINKYNVSGGDNGVLNETIECRKDIEAYVEDLKFFQDDEA